MNILLTGGTGYIGNVLTRILIDQGHEVRILTRDKDVHRPFYHWDKNKIDEKIFKNLDGIIHLAGASLMKRWSTKYKEEIIRSRVDTANQLFEYVQRLNIPLKFFISAAGSSYYGQQTSDHIFTENDALGTDYLAEVCRVWEEAAMQFKTLGTRVVCLRTPLVISKDGPSFQLMKGPTAKRLGACLGDGNQWVSWIHLEDLCRIYAESCTNTSYQGAINVVADESVTHQQFMNQLAEAYQTKIYMPNIPSFLVKVAMGEKADLVLEGSRLSNEKLHQLGFQFHYPTLKSFFKEL